ncbi:MAG: hypothetical protein AAB048_00355, partial [Planctomycetota bacterium]
MSTSLLDAPPTYRYKDIIELLRERGIWAKIKRLLIVRDAIDKALKDSRPYLESLEKDIHGVEDISQFSQNRKYLSDIPLPRYVKATADLAVAVKSATVIFVTVPSFAFREVL